jgi:hypothetical protein
MVKVIAIAFVAAAFSPATLAGAVDRQGFYRACQKSSAFPLSLFKAERRAGIERIFDYWEKTSYTDDRWLAYIIGTAYRESGGTMQPVREGLCNTDDCSIKAVTAHFGSKKISSNYAIPDANGHSYFGRGLVQITHKKKYQSVGRALGWGNELADHPELALDPEKATVILVEGMAQGMFTKCSLANMFTDKTSMPQDWIDARCIVNPHSKRAKITADHALAFHTCLVTEK